MTKKELKRLNKEHCKNMPLDIKLQCWFYRNKDEIAEIFGCIVASITTAILVTIF